MFTIPTLAGNELNPDFIAFKSYDFAVSMSSKFRGTQKELSKLTNYLYIPYKYHAKHTVLTPSQNMTVMPVLLY